MDTNTNFDGATHEIDLNPIINAVVRRQRGTVQLAPVSSAESIEDLASELAETYVDYLTVDTSDEQVKYEESIEECLTQLEEVSAVLEVFAQNATHIEDFFARLTERNRCLDKLYDQIDAIEQYMFETTRSLEQLDTEIKQLETRNKRRLGTSRISQILNVLPKLSISSVNIFGNLGGLIEESPPSFVQPPESDEQGTVDHQTVRDILAKISNIEESMSRTTSKLAESLINTH